MLKFPTTLAGLMALTLGVMGAVPSAEAFTLYENQLSNNSSNIKWDIPFKGTVKIATDLQAIGTGDLEVQILVNDEENFSQVIRGTSSSDSNTQLSRTLEVEKDSVIELVVSAANSGANSNFTLGAEITLPGTHSLVFLGTEEGKFDHVGFFNHQNNEIYESSPAYQDGNYFDILDGIVKSITPFEGVQQEHGLGTFLNLDSAPDASIIKEIELIDISDPKYKSQEIEDFIKSQLGAGYTFTSPDFPLLPQEHKGDYGTFSGVGLPEQAAEAAGVQKGHGIIPNHLEFIYITNFLFDQALLDIPWECIEIFPATAECLARYTNRSPSGIPVATLSPDFMHYLLTNPDFPNEDGWLQGKLHLMDFLVTDPQGRRLGYVEDMGEFREIPDAYYSGNQVDEHFQIDKIIPGQYKLEFFGLCDNDEAFAMIGDDENGTFISGCKPDNPQVSNPGEQPVPEPATTFGLLMLGIAGAGWKWRKNGKNN